VAALLRARIPEGGRWYSHLRLGCHRRGKFLMNCSKAINEAQDSKEKLAWLNTIFIKIRELENEIHINASGGHIIKILTALFYQASHIFFIKNQPVLYQSAYMLKGTSTWFLSV